MLSRPLPRACTGTSRAPAPTIARQACIGRRSDARERVDVRRVAGKQLVAAVAGQTDRDVLARQLRDVERRDRRRVGKRLVVVQRQRLGDSDAVRRDDLFVVIGAEMRWRSGAPRSTSSYAGIAEADRERVDRPRREASSSARARRPSPCRRSETRRAARPSAAGCARLRSARRAAPRWPRPRAGTRAPAAPASSRTALRSSCRSRASIVSAVPGSSRRMPSKIASGPAT